MSNEQLVVYIGGSLFIILGFVFAAILYRGDKKIESDLGSLKDSFKEYQTHVAITYVDKKSIENIEQKMNLHSDLLSAINTSVAVLSQKIDSIPKRKGD